MAVSPTEVRSIAAQLELIRMSVEAECVIAEFLNRPVEADLASESVEVASNN